MIAADYVPNVQALALMVTGIAQLPLDDMADLNERWQAIGPILDPTAYRAGEANLTDQRELITAARKLCETAHAIQQRAAAGANR